MIRRRRGEIRRRERGLPWALLVLVVSLSIPVLIRGEVRTWTSTDGQTLEAEYVGGTDGTVTIRRTDGRQFTLPLERLSEGDRAWVTRMLSEKDAADGKPTEVWGKDGETWDPEAGTLIDFSLAGYHEGKNDFPDDWKVGADVTQHGAKGDGVTDDTEAFKKAIEACGEEEVVYIPNGVYKLTDWLGVNEMVDKWVKPRSKNRFAFRGESREGTVVLLGKGLAEIHPWEQTTGHGRPTTQWSWSGGFLWFQDCEEVGVENLTIKGGTGPYDIHWKEAGCNGIFFRDVKNGWVRQVTLVDVDNGIITNHCTNITLQDLVFESTPERPSRSDFEDNEGISGHHGISFNSGSAWCVADNIVFKNRWHHEIGVNPETNHCVFSNVKGPDLHLDFHTSEDNIQNILFTQIDVGSGEHMWRNNFYGACRGTVLWNIRGEDVALPEGPSHVKHTVDVAELKCLIAGWPGRLPNAKEPGRPWFEDIRPDDIHPQNIYHAQRRKRFGEAE